MRRVLIAVIIIALFCGTATAGVFGFPSSLSGTGLLSSGNTAQNPYSNYLNPGSSSLVPSSPGGYPSTYVQPSSSGMSLNGISGVGNMGGIGGTSMPSGLFNSVPTTFDDKNWAVKNMQFFNGPKASAKPPQGFSQQDMSAIMDYISKLPAPDQVQQYNNNTSQSSSSQTQNSSTNKTQEFTNVSTVIPSDYVIFIEKTNMIMSTDPNMQFAMPNVTGNYQYKDSDKSLWLKKKPGIDINQCNIVVGLDEQDDRVYKYTYDYDAGKVPDVTLMGVHVIFAGADGRVSIMYGDKRYDLMPGEKFEFDSQEGQAQITLSIKNYGLIPRSKISVQEIK